MLPPTTPTKPSRIMQLRNLPLRGEAVILAWSNRDSFHRAQSSRGEGSLEGTTPASRATPPPAHAFHFLRPSLKRRLYFPGVSFTWTCRPGGPSSKVSSHPRRKGWEIRGRFRGAGGQAGPGEARRRRGYRRALAGTACVAAELPPGSRLSGGRAGRVGHL